MKFDKLPDQLPQTPAELEELAAPIRDELNLLQLQAKVDPDKCTDEDVARVEALTEAYVKVDAAKDAAIEAEQTHGDRLASALEAASKATAPKPEPVAEPAPEPEPEVDIAKTVADTTADEADVVKAAEAATAEAAEPVAVTAAAKAPAKPVSFAGKTTNSEAPAPVDGDGDEKRRKPFLLASTAPNFAEHDGQQVDTAVIAAGLASKQGEFTGLRDGVPTVLATMQRPQGKVFETHDEFLTELDRVTSEVKGEPVTAGRLVAAGGWCAPSEQQFGFDPTHPAVGLLSFPEMNLGRAGIIIPSEPDFASLQTGFYFTEPELEADSGSPNYTPTAIKNIVEIPCPPAMTEYRKEAIGWGVKAGILQQRAWPELIKKFLDEFLVAHQQRISAKSVIKVLGMSSAAKTVPTDVVLGATGSILNGLHQRARNIQIRRRITTIGGIAPIWFRDVLRADLANRDGLEVLDVTDADVDRWLAARDIYLQYEGTWQSLGAGQPGDYNTSWWPGSVDVALFPAGAFWRALDNVLTVGAMYDIDMLQKNRQLVGFVEDEFQVGIRPSDVGSSHLIRIPLCVNGAVGAREHIDCSTEYAATVTKSFSFPGTPTGGGATMKFSANPTLPSSSIAFNAATSAVDTALTGIDDGVTQAGDIVVTGGPLPAAVSVTYPARLGDLQLGTNSLTGGTQPGAGVTIT